ncbi:MAG: response regulator transcription factor [Treponema sp.]|nr:response regulator transcription factor [Treponema sp.]
MKKELNQNMGRVLVVEDDVDLNNANRRVLELHGYSVQTAFSLAEAWDCLEKTEPDIILLDVMLGDGDGFEFCRDIREKTQAHILFLTAKTEYEDIVSGLSSGGDDYITKPFRVDELLARVESVMRRRGMPVSLKTINKGKLVINMVSDQVFLDGQDLLLSQKEFSILCLMVQNEGKHLDAEYIYKMVWGRQVGNDINAVRVTVSRLRRKLENSGYNIFAKRAQGYVFDKKNDNGEAEDDPQLYGGGGGGKTFYFFFPNKKGFSENWAL